MKVQPNKDGVLTNPMDRNSREFKELQLFLLKKAQELSLEEKLQIELLALQYKMEDYLKATIDENSKMSVGDFLRLYLKNLGIKQSKLATYIGLQPSNFNRILSGERRINFELSMILGQLFQVDPQIWLNIQVKNDYLRLEAKKDYSKFKLQDLLPVK